MTKKIYTLTIEPLTGIHIGTGKEITPLDYKLANTLEGTKFSAVKYLKFSSDKILSRIIKSGNKQKLAEFERASVSGNMKVLQEFFQENCSSFEDLDYPCDVTRNFFNLYNKNCEKDPYDNAARVFQMYRPDGLKTPVIPGSSLKGAIRTAILNMKMTDLPNSEYNHLYDRFIKGQDYKKLEQEIQQKVLFYSDIKNDPFRGIGLADASFKAKKTQLVGVLKNISYNRQTYEVSALDKLQITAEILRGVLIDGEAKTQTMFFIDTGLQREKQIPSLSIQDICSSCNHFFKQEFDAEYKKFYKECVEHIKIIDHLKEQLDKIGTENPNEFIIRVGRWSQVEFVTFKQNFRKPKTPFRKGTAMSYGETRTVLDYDGEYVPLGWCKCTFNEEI